MNSMNNDESSFVVKDFHGFVDSARSLVFNSFGKNTENDTDELSIKINESEQNELDRILSFEESSVICKEFLQKQTNKKTNRVRYIVNDDIFMSIIESLNDRMTSNILNDLVRKGLVETGYDSESNDFIFWIKDDNQKPEKEKPETD